MGLEQGVRAVGRDGPRSIPINGAGGGHWLSLGAPMAVLGSGAGAGSAGQHAGEDNRGPGRYDSVELEADHRRHAEIENAIRDLKHGVGLNHLPSGRFAANGAWLAVQVLAHNLARWTARIGLGEQVVTTRTLRRRLFSLAGRLTPSARRLTLHLPQGWPKEIQFTRALARLRALPLPA